MKNPDEASLDVNASPLLLLFIIWFLRNCNITVLLNLFSPKFSKHKVRILLLVDLINYFDLRK